MQVVPLLRILDPMMGMVCMVTPPKIGLEFLCVQILEYFDSKSITREIVIRGGQQHPDFGPRSCSLLELKKNYIYC